MTASTSTAYLVAHAYTDPNGKMLPQIHACRIYSDRAGSLSISPENTASLDIYHASAESFQEAYDLLCHTVQNLEVFAWCRPLLPEQALEPVDHFVLDGSTNPNVIAVLARVLHLGTTEARTRVRMNRLPMIREKVLIHLNQSLQEAGETVRAYMHRDYAERKAKKEEPS